MPNPEKQFSIETRVVSDSKENKERPGKVQEFEGVMFEESNDGGNGFLSIALGRKPIELSATSPKPEKGKIYTVRVVEDTDTEDALGGKYIAEIVPDN